MTKGITMTNAIIESIVIVHSGSPPDETVAIDGTRISFGEFVDRIADYLRDAVKELMRRTERAGETHTIEMLDADIIAGR